MDPHADFLADVLPPDRRSCDSHCEVHELAPSTLLLKTCERTWRLSHGGEQTCMHFKNGTGQNAHDLQKALPFWRNENGHKKTSEKQPTALKKQLLSPVHPCSVLTGRAPAAPPSPRTLRSPRARRPTSHPRCRWSRTRCGRRPSRAR